MIKRGFIPPTNLIHQRIIVIIFVFMVVNSLAFPSKDSLIVTRNYIADSFHDAETMYSCSMESCIGWSSGTANIMLNPANREQACFCRCLPNLPTFREDLHLCVDDIHECTLGTFVSGSTRQKIPYVFLPLKGQIVYPSAEIILSEEGAVATKENAHSICLVSRSRYLSQIGWLDIRNYTNGENAFKLYTDEHRTFLQWTGSNDLRNRMEGRLLLIELICKKVNSQEIFTPCISFRVAGTPSVTEVYFSTDNTSSDDDNSISASNDDEDDRNQSSSFLFLSFNEYLIIAISSLVLGLVYVASVLLYLHVKKSSNNNNSNNNNNRRQSDWINKRHHYTDDGHQEGIIKNNPLLLKRYDDNTGYLSDVTSCTSDGDHQDIPLPPPPSSFHQLVHQNKETTTQAMVHNVDEDGGGGGVHEWIYGRRSSTMEKRKKRCDTGLFQSQDNVERLPENISIIETMEEPSEAILCSNPRRKLYFNPAFFEPQLLLAPPPAALEFLEKIREVIGVAKHKMAMKRYSPSLSEIPEEMTEEINKKDLTSIVDTCNSQKDEAIERWLLQSSNGYDKPPNYDPTETTLAQNDLQDEITQKPVALMNAVIKELLNGQKSLKRTTEVKKGAPSIASSIDEEHTASEYSSDNVNHIHNSTFTLPMDEEVTMHNTIYNKATGNTTLPKLKRSRNKSNDHHYEVIQRNEGYSLVSQVYVNDGYSSGSSGPSEASSLDYIPEQITLDTSSQLTNGQLTIHLQDDQQIDYSTDNSDDFEPDTLDRKFNKLDECIVDSLERPKISFNTSFKRGRWQEQDNVSPLFRSFNSLHEIYESHHNSFHRSPSLTCSPRSLNILSGDTSSESRYWRRQRQSSPPPPLPTPSPILAMSPRLDNLWTKHTSSRRLIKPPLPPTVSDRFFAIDSKTAKNHCLHTSGKIGVKVNRPQDSGYLSTDSDESRKIAAKDTDQESVISSNRDKDSESGGESIATEFHFYKNDHKRWNSNNNGHVLTS